MASAEPFPPFNTSTEPLHSVAEQTTARRRPRKSSGLPAEIRAGDTGAPSLQTSLASLQSNSSFSSLSSRSTTTTITTDGNTKKGSKRRKARSLLRRCKHFVFKHSWVLPLILLCIFGSIYAINPTESNPVHRFIFLSYKLPLEPGADPTAPAQYGKGLWDIAFVFFYTVVLSFTREFIMQEFLRPLARKAGLKSRGKQARFMEQLYTAIYFGFLGPAGMYVMSHTPIWYFNTRAMYENFPHKTHAADFKFYYLFQAAYWAQQAIVLLLGLEERRKDFKELVGHHIVSLALIGLSYRFHFTYMGLAVYITHDISDFFLATSKTLNYIDHWATGPYFFLFMCVWGYLRHYLNLRIIWSLFTEFKTVGPYELNWETQQYKCELAFFITLVLLASLQALNLFWWFFIVRIAYRFVVYKTADDDRSEAEESELEEIEASNEKTSATPLLLNGHATGANGHANGSVKSRPNGAASKKKSTR
ncbi:longevity assurance proteins LAG1/LAC1 [Xylariaceae sp. AK1471]|nr:longevity assurance proteins LAG1/LAC1 [Xylariaceae sp. AK1471]